MVEVLYSIRIPHMYFYDDTCLSGRIQELDEVPGRQGKTMRLSSQSLHIPRKH
jgi:hypothetical protein